ncbi:hypothetical protein WMY93_015120 [Mugilogobius chulae]|uniref:Uncharacterized protein n=1 Tax=Mugilogobius chulae TaxID=88201 RepID=A0AAW0P682_9GOBI
MVRSQAGSKESKKRLSSWTKWHSLQSLQELSIFTETPMEADVCCLENQVNPTSMVQGSDNIYPQGERLCEITTTTVLKMDAKASSYIRKWLGLPRCLATSALFGRNILKLPTKSITLGYKQEKAQLVLELKDSPDPVIQSTNVKVRTGRK